MEMILLKCAKVVILHVKLVSEGIVHNVFLVIPLVLIMFLQPKSVYFVLKDSMVTIHHNLVYQIVQVNFLFSINLIFIK